MICEFSYLKVTFKLHEITFKEKYTILVLHSIVLLEFEMFGIKTDGDDFIFIVKKTILKLENMKNISVLFF